MSTDDEQAHQEPTVSGPTEVQASLLAAEIYSTYRVALLRFVRNLAYSFDLSEAQLDTEGVVHDVFAAALVRWETIEHPRAWLYKVARRHVIRAAIKAHRTVTADASHLEQAAGRGWWSLAAQSELEDIVAVREITHAIARLPGKQATATYLARVENWSTSEIADLLNCAQSTAGVHIHRGTHELRRVHGGVISGDGANTMYNISPASGRSTLIFWLLLVLLLAAPMARLVALHLMTVGTAIVITLIALAVLGLARWWFYTRW